MSLSPSKEDFLNVRKNDLWTNLFIGKYIGDLFEVCFLELFIKVSLSGFEIMKKIHSTGDIFEL